MGGGFSEWISFSQLATTIQAEEGCQNLVNRITYLFDLYGRDDGAMNYSSFLKCCRGLKLPRSFTEDLFEACDRDKDGCIDGNEFMIGLLVAFATPKCHSLRGRITGLTRARRQIVFLHCDLDKDGVLNVSEWNSLLRLLRRQQDGIKSAALLLGNCMNSSALCMDADTEFRVETPESNQYVANIFLRERHGEVTYDEYFEALERHIIKEPSHVFRWSGRVPQLLGGSTPLPTVEGVNDAIEGFKRHAVLAGTQLAKMLQSRFQGPNSMFLVQSAGKLGVSESPSTPRETLQENLCTNSTSHAATSLFDSTVAAECSNQAGEAIQRSPLRESEPTEAHSVACAGSEEIKTNPSAPPDVGLVVADLKSEPRSPAAASGPTTETVAVETSLSCHCTNDTQRPVVEDGMRLLACINAKDAFIRYTVPVLNGTKHPVGAYGRDELLKVLLSVAVCVGEDGLLPRYREDLLKRKTIFVGALDGEYSRGRTILQKLFKMDEGEGAGTLLPSGCNIVFTGNLICPPHGGEAATNCLDLLFAILALKLAWPEQVFLVRGRNEAKENGQLAEACAKAVGNAQEGILLYQDLMDFCDYLPIGWIMTRRVLVIGGCLTPDIPNVFDRLSSLKQTPLRVDDMDSEDELRPLSQSYKLPTTPNGKRVVLDVLQNVGVSAIIQDQMISLADEEPKTFALAHMSLTEGCETPQFTMERGDSWAAIKVSRLEPQISCTDLSTGDGLEFESDVEEFCRNVAS